MQIRAHIAALLVTVAGCTNDQKYQSIVSKADSSATSVTQTILRLRAMDSAKISSSLALYRAYSSYLSDNFRDTLGIQQAQLLTVFDNSGRRLKSCVANRAVLLERGTLLSGQLKALRADAVAKGQDHGQLERYLAEELRSAGEFTALAEREVNAADQALRMLDSTFTIVKELIRQQRQ